MFIAVCVLAPGIVLLAADPSWRTKAIPSWTEDDARQLLTSSPWAKRIVATLARKLTEDEQRQGGKMGEDHGVGFDGVDDKRPKATLPKNVFTGPKNANVRPPQGTILLRIRWESALPIRAAELKAQVSEQPTLPGEGYSIAVYGIPTTYFPKGDPKVLGEPLRKLANLRREGKPDVLPISVEVFQLDDGLSVVYLFPLSAELNLKDGNVAFNAQIGRLVVSHDFMLEEMQYQGKLEL